MESKVRMANIFNQIKYTWTFLPCPRLKKIFAIFQVAAFCKIIRWVYETTDDWL